MDTKLTLKLDEEIISRAKKYAAEKKVSLSKLIENYLSLVTRESKNRPEVSSIVESLTGIIPSNFDEKKEYRDYVDQKHS